jgi:electron transport complex protein RnfG
VKPALGLSARTGSVMVAFTVVFTAVMAFTYDATRDPDRGLGHRREDEAHLRGAARATATTTCSSTTSSPLGPTRELGLDDGGRVYRARKAGQPAALLLEATAPDGYSGRIELIVAVAPTAACPACVPSPTGKPRAWATTSTPRRTRTRKSPWIGQFAELKAADVPRCKLRKDGGRSPTTPAPPSAPAPSPRPWPRRRLRRRQPDRLFAAPSGDKL